MATAIMFVGKDDVMKAFDSRGLDTWGLFQGKQFMTAGEGSEQLEQWLERLEKTGNVIYTLKVSREDAEDITSVTRDFGSFNFKLPTQSMMSGAGYSREYIDLTLENERLKKELKELQEEEDE